MNQDSVADVDTAVTKTFSQMFGFEVKGSFRTAQILPGGDVTALIEMGSKEKPLATLAVVFPKQTIFSILKRIYKTDFAEVDSRVMGAVGEMANVIYGVFKFRMVEKGVQLGLALPKVFAGSAPASVATPATLQWLYVGNYLSADGPFQVSLAKHAG